MKYPNLMVEAVQAGNVVRARSVVLSLLNKDRTLPEHEMPKSAKYAWKELGNLKKDFYEPDDGKTGFTENQDEWNHEGWERLIVELEGNFSEKKMEHVFEMMIVLRERKDPNFMPKERPVDSQLNQTSETSTQQRNNNQGETREGIGRIIQRGFAVIREKFCEVGTLWTDKDDKD